MVPQEPSYLSVLVLTLCWTQCISTIDNGTLSLTRAFVGVRKLSSLVAFTCWEGDSVNLAKLWSIVRLRVMVIQPLNLKADLCDVLKVDYHQLAVVIDLTCEGSFNLLEQVSEKRLFTKLHSWLLLASPGTEDVVMSALRHLILPLDSQVTVAVQQLNQFKISDVYQFGEGQPLTNTVRQNWTSSQKLFSPPKRDSYRGMKIKVGLTILQDPWEHFMDLQYRHLNTWTKVNYMYTSHVARMLNFSMEIIHAPYWGWPDVNGSYDGVIGQLQRGEIEIAGGGIFMQKGRFRALNYAAMTNTYRGSFIFLQPSLPEVEIIYTLPFDTTVWITIVATVIVLTVLIVIIQHFEQRMDLGERSQRTLSWNDAWLNSLGIICQQGPPTSPSSSSSRIVFLFLLLLSVFLFTSYSATIVMLLQAPSPAIRTLSDLMNSPLTLCMQNIVSNTKYVNETIDPEVKRLYWKKLYNQPQTEAFVSPEIGIAKVRKGLVAFHGDMATGYKIISDTYEEHEKCRLRMVQMISTVLLVIPVRKGSPYAEHINQKMMWVRETGLMQREDQVWVIQAPKCLNNDGRFVIISLLEFFPIIEVLLFGILGSVVILLLEILYYNSSHIIIKV